MGIQGEQQALSEAAKAVDRAAKSRSCSFVFMY
jgi:hypothetical protein